MKFNYKPLPSSLTIGKSSIDGLGLIATKNISAGQKLGVTHHLDFYDEKTLIRTPLGGFLNHSDSPNCFIDKTYTLYTVVPITKGTELTVYYRLTQ